MGNLTFIIALQSFVMPWPLFQFLNPIHSRGISLLQGRCLRTGQHRHACLVWESNPRPNCLSGRPLWSAKHQLDKIVEWGASQVQLFNWCYGGSVKKDELAEAFGMRWGDEECKQRTRPRRTWEDNIKIILGERGVKTWIQVSKDRVWWRANWSRGEHVISWKVASFLACGVSSNFSKATLVPWNWLFQASLWVCTAYSWSRLQWLHCCGS
jgi:hypothetical protein